MFMSAEVLMFGFEHPHPHSSETHRQSGQRCFADGGGASDRGGHG